MTPGPLHDRFGRFHRYLRISVTDRCNFRCRYCMPHEGVPWKRRDDLLTIEEIARMVRVFADLGVNKVRLTGGEPTVRRGLDTLISEIAGTKGIESLHMTTNGWNLRSMAAHYRSLGVRYINVSLDTLVASKFEYMTGQRSFSEVWEGLHAALDAGYEKVKVNVVVMKGFNEDELVDFVALTKDRAMEVRFIEFMPFDKNEWSRDRLVSYLEMRKAIERVYPLVPIGVPPTAVAKEFKVDGHRGTVGFVTSMTDHFCAGCDRVRLTADGGIKPCLFFPPATSVLPMLRNGASDAQIVEAIHSAIQVKRREHPPMLSLVKTKNAAMVSIGG